MVCLTKHRATLSSLNISRRYDEHAFDTKIFFLMLETEESISETDSHHILQEASEKRVPSYLTSKARSGKHMVSVNNCLQFLNLGTVLESPFL